MRITSGKGSIFRGKTQLPVPHTLHTSSGKAFETSVKPQQLCKIRLGKIQRKALKKTNHKAQQKNDIQMTFYVDFMDAAVAGVSS